MVMSGSQNLTLVIEARDMASQRMNQVGQKLGYVEYQARAAAYSMVRFTSIMGALGISAYGIINLLRDQWESMEKMNRAATTLTSQLRFMGFSAEDAAASVKNLRGNLNSAAFQSLPGMDKAMKTFITNFDPDHAKQVELYSKILSELFGVDQQAAIKAVTESMAGNNEALEKITGFNESLVEQGPKLLAMWKEYQDSLTKTQRGLMEVSETAGVILPMAFSNLLSGLGQFIDNIIDLPLNVSDLKDKFKAWIGAGLGSIGEGLGGLGAMIGKGIGDAVVGAWETIQSWGRVVGAYFMGGIMAFMSTGIPDFFTKTLPGFFTEQLPNFAVWVFDKFKEVGGNIVGGIWAGITGMASWLWSRVTAFATEIANAVKRGLGPLNPFGPPVATEGGQAHQGVEGFQAQSFRTSSTSGGSQMLNVTLQVDREKFGKVVMQVVDGKVRLMEPGVGIA